MKLERTAQEPVPCVPAPDWVDHQPYLSNIPDSYASCIANGLCRLLFDVQVDLCHGDPAWHIRTAQRVLTREGAEHAAHVVADFDPGFQRLEFHFVRVVRGDERIEHARPDAFQLLRRETNLERRIFDGRLTASLVIPDVRVGDIVELSLTVYGGVPVLKGKYAAWVAFDSFNPCYDARQRLLRPLERRLHAKPFNDPPDAIVAVSGQIEDARWQLTGQRRRELEPLTPPWLVLRPALQLSEFETWNEVASLFAPFYADDALPETLVVEIDRIAAAADTPDRRAVEWLRFVQRELRYFAVSLGEGGLTPRPLDTIWGTRFGDCKDATRFYVAGARRLGLDACAALVSTTHGYSLRDLIPSPAVFDHCIVRLQLDGRSYWLDPTVPAQSGNLQHLSQPHAGWALPLTLQTMELETLGSEEPLHIIHIEDELTVGPKRASTATFRRHTDFFSWGADVIRHRFANEGTSGYAQAVLRELQSAWPSIAEAAPIGVSDDPIRNCVTITSRYEICDCWRAADRGSDLNLVVPSGNFAGELQPLTGAERETDIHLGRPRKISSVLQVNMPTGWPGAGWRQRFETSRARYIDNCRMEGRTILNTRELIIDARSLPASEAKAYADLTKRLRENLLIIAAREWFGKIRQRDHIKRRLLVGGARVLWFVVVMAFVSFLIFRSSQHH